MPLFAIGLDFQDLYDNANDIKYLDGRFPRAAGRRGRVGEAVLQAGAAAGHGARTSAHSSAPGGRKERIITLPTEDHSDTL